MKITARSVALVLVPLTWAFYAFSSIYFDEFRNILWNLRLLDFLESPIYVVIFVPVILGVWIYFECRKLSILITGVLPTVIGALIMTCGLFCVYILGPLTTLGLIIAALSYVVFCVQVIRMNLPTLKMTQVGNKDLA